MKILSRTLIFFLLLFITTFPQDRIHEGVLQERLQEINSSILNGFLLTEQTVQNWEGSTWVTSHMYSYSYDVKNNPTRVVVTNLGRF